MDTQDPRDGQLSRRRFVQGLALGGVAAGLGLRAGTAVAQAVAVRREWRGTHFELAVGELPVNFTGRRRIATVVNGQLPAPLLRWREGDTVTLKVTNRLRVPTSIHWHGILVPFQMDGVPGISFPGIAPGESFTYRFPVRQSGTYWYHSHSGFQEQTGLYGPLVIEPAGGERFPAERDYVVMLNDWSDDSPEHIFATLKRQSDYYNYAMPTVPDFFRDVREHGLEQALARRRMWERMRMNPTDYSDVSGHTYTYLVNGHPPAGNWTGLFRPGEKVRLRFINGSSMTFFDVRIPGLKMTVVAADGQDVEPVSVDEFRIAVAETYDVIVEPKEDRAYTLFAQAIDRSGYARGTLAPRTGMQAAVPAMDPLVWLGMRDMMGAMGQGGTHGNSAMP
ncbi:MAG: copper resistance system multicopper oxidase, partial [Xanthomonadaceae bacterium]|nr:copper resistance system multicopper oxidase [Xanthomonadaceae bacterium]